MRSLEKLRRKALAWKRDEQGVVAIIVAFSMVAFIGLMGAGIDYSTSVIAQSKTQSAGDAAALRAIVSLRKAMDQGQPYDRAVTSALVDAQSAYNAQLGSVQFGHPSAPKIELIRDPATNQVTVTIRTAGYIDTSFMKVLGIDSQSYSSTATASGYLKSYINMVFLLDTSQSMGLMGDAASIATALNDTNMKCQFACHDSKERMYFDASISPWQKAPNVYSDNLWLYARCRAAAGYGNMKLRIDYLREAVAATLDQAASSRNYYTASVLTYGSKGVPTPLRSDTPRQTEQCPDKIHSVTYGTYATNDMPPPSSDDLKNGSVKDLSKLTPLIDIEDNTFMTDTLQDVANTNYQFLFRMNGARLIGLTQTEAAMTWLQNNLPVSGNGLSSDAPIQVVVLISDGTQMRNASPLKETALNAGASCTPLKMRGSRLMVLYTEYLPAYNANNTTYQERILPIASEIEPQMQDCATAGLYAKATQGNQITDALTGLFNSLEKSLVVGLTH